jgi:UDP-glucose-4-epimerase GalE
MGTRILVVGGAGYIGSITAEHLRQSGHEVVTYDDLSTGHREAVRGELIVGDVRDRPLLRRVLGEGRFDGVLHFAAQSLVGESTRDPRRTFDINVGGTLALLDAMFESGVRALVFSSSCSVYGTPVRVPIDERHARKPESPYGETKAAVERILELCRAREGLRVTSLRYFNAAGAMPDGSLGESHAHETHLIPLAIAAALGSRPPLEIYGDDYPTPDGTCIRDYVHVLDLADAHRRALERLIDGDRGGEYNLGTGTGHSVREVLQATARVLGRAVPHRVGRRREGDPSQAYADPTRAKETLGWEPHRTRIDAIIDTAARWARAPRY